MPHEIHVVFICGGFTVNGRNRVSLDGQIVPKYRQEFIDVHGSQMKLGFFHPL